MAGHSQFKNIMHRKGAQDIKRGKIFAKIAREIIVAAKSGLPDPTLNPRLRSAMSAARLVNMPRDNIERAIKKASGNDDTSNFEEIRYEGYGPGGTALIVEVLTDNRNRIGPEIRAAFAKYGGNLGETGSVSFMFEHLGLVRIPDNISSFDSVFEKAIESGASNIEEIDGFFEITTAVMKFAEVRDVFENNYGEKAESKLIWRPLNTIDCNEEVAQKLLKLIDLLEDNDDIQNVYANFEISNEVMERL